LGPFGPQAGVSAGVLGLALGLREAKRQRGSRWTVEEVPGFWAGYAMGLTQVSHHTWWLFMPSYAYLCLFTIQSLNSSIKKHDSTIKYADIIIK